MEMFFLNFFKPAIHRNKDDKNRITNKIATSIYLMFNFR